MSLRDKLGVGSSRPRIPTVKETVATAQPVQRVRKINEGFATKVVEQKNEDAEKTFREELDRIAKEAAIKRQDEEYFLDPKGAESQYLTQQERLKLLEEGHLKMDKLNCDDLKEAL